MGVTNSKRIYGPENKDEVKGVGDDKDKDKDKAEDAAAAGPADPKEEVDKWNNCCRCAANQSALC